MLVQSSRLAEFGGLGMSFKICRGTLGSFAMFTAIRNASSRDSRFALERRPARLTIDQEITLVRRINTARARLNGRTNFGVFP